MSLMIFWAGLCLGFLLGWVCRALLPRDREDLDAWLDELVRQDRDWRR